MSYIYPLLMSTPSTKLTTMRKILTFIAFALCYALAFAQSNRLITTGTIETMESKILGETRRVWVYVPGSAMNDISGPKNYPVLYLLDGDAHFLSMVGMVQQFSRNTLCPEMIVVGIANTDRTRDLTTSNIPGPIRLMGNVSAPTSGGSDKFLAFIEKELMPYIESKYPTQPYKIFVGHSFGGLTVINAFINHPHMFSAYLSIDPGMWWDNEKLLSQAQSVLRNKKFEGKSLYMSIANTLLPGMDSAQAMADTTMNSQFFRSIMKLDGAFRANSANGLRYGSKFYSADDHNSIPIISIHDGLRSIFSFYQFNLTAADIAGFNAETLNRIDKHYESVSRLMGYPVKFPEMMANALAYRFMGEGRMAQSEMLFALNIKNYPDSFNVYDSMGEYQEAIGNKQKAIELYKKALSIREFPVTREKLERLLKEK